MSAATIPATAARPSSGTRERVVRFGAGQGLAGILSTPRVARPGAPYVVFVNAGIIHRVGPNRLYVDLARALAALGYPVLRFDLAGLGDSAVGTGGASLSESAVADVRAALDHLASARQATAFVVAGLCSGANYTLLSAFADTRVVGTLVIDPTVMRTRKSQLVHLARRLRHAGTWGALLTLRHPAWRRSLERLRSASVADAVAGQSTQRARLQGQTPSPAEVRASLARLVERGVQLMFVFTGGVNHVYNYRGQLFDLLPGFDFRQQLRLEFMPDTDHTVSDRPSRAALIGAVSDWMTHGFPGDARSEGPV